MSLWLALTWLICAAICGAVFAFCKKRTADIGQRVAEEIENRVNKILAAERDAESRLLESFTNFDNPAEAIRIYQKITSEIFSSHNSKPAWNWTGDDIKLWRRQCLAQETASRGRATVLTTGIIILAVIIAATLTTVITLNSVNPVLASAGSSANTASSGTLPQAVSLPSQNVIKNLPPLPTKSSAVPADNFTGTNQPPSSTNNGSSSNIGSCNNQASMNSSGRITDPVGSGKGSAVGKPVSSKVGCEKDNNITDPNDLNDVNNCGSPNQVASDSKGGIDND